MKTRTAGFTLVEIIIAISVIGLVVTAAAELTQSSLSVGHSSMQKFMANHVAEEGLEIVRNMRDSNWLRSRPWREKLTDGTYMITQNNEVGARDSGMWNLEKIPAESDGRTVGVGNEEFKRVIEITTPQSGDLPAETMRVVSKVSYLQKGVKKQVALTMQMADWKKGPL